MNADVVIRTEKKESVLFGGWVEGLGFGRFFYVQDLLGTIALETIGENACCCRYAFIFYSLQFSVTREPKRSLESQDPGPSSDIDSAREMILISLL